MAPWERQVIGSSSLDSILCHPHGPYFKKNSLLTGTLEGDIPPGRTFRPAVCGTKGEKGDQQLPPLPDWYLLRPCPISTFNNSGKPDLRSPSRTVFLTWLSLGRWMEQTIFFIIPVSSQFSDGEPHTPASSLFLEPKQASMVPALSNEPLAQPHVPLAACRGPSSKWVPRDHLLTGGLPLSSSHPISSSKAGRLPPTFRGSRDRERLQCKDGRKS